MVKKYPLGRVLSLGSSSEGNSYYIEINRKGYPNPFKLLIECGFRYKDLMLRLINNGIKIRDINAVLVTHEHHDHCLAVPDLVNRGFKVFAPRSVFKHWNILDSVPNNQIMEPNRTKRIADNIDVLGFELEHKNPDGTNICNLGYIIKAKCDYGLYQTLFVTDTHYIKYDLSKWIFNTIFIEANNITRNIIFSLKQAKANGDTYKEIHYDRVLHSHMLVENTIKTLIGTKKRNGFNLSKTDFIYLIHLTAGDRSNVNPQVIKTMVIDALKKSKNLRIKTVNQKQYVSPKVFVFKKNGEII